MPALQNASLQRAGPVSAYVCVPGNPKPSIEDTVYRAAELDRAPPFRSKAGLQAVANSRSSPLDPLATTPGLSACHGCHAHPLFGPGRSTRLQGAAETASP